MTIQSHLSHGRYTMRAKTVEDTVEIAVQINGKTKGTLEIGKQDP